MANSRFEDIGAIIAEIFDPYIETVAGTPDRRSRLIEKSRQLRERIEASHYQPSALNGYPAVLDEMHDIISAQILEVSIHVPSILPPSGGMVS